MLERNNTTLAESLIETIGLFPGVTPKKIYEKSLKVGHKVSIQSIYKALNELKKANVIIETNHRYSLHQTWIKKFKQKIDKIEFANTLGLKKEEILPRMGEKRIWNFDNLFDMVNLWAHVLMAITYYTDDRMVFAYNPHDWFVLAFPKEEWEFRTAFADSGAFGYTVYGGKTYLDKLAQNHYQPNSSKISFRESPFHKDRKNYYNQMADFLITAKVHSTTASEIDEYYKSIKKAKDIKPGDFLNLFSPKRPCKLIVEAGTKKQISVRRTLMKHFGVE